MLRATPTINKSCLFHGCGTSADPCTVLMCRQRTLALGREQPKCRAGSREVFLYALQGRHDTRGQTGDGMRNVGRTILSRSRHLATVAWLLTTGGCAGVQEPVPES